MTAVTRTVIKTMAKCLVAKDNVDGDIEVKEVDVPFYGDYIGLSDKKKREYAEEVVPMYTNGAYFVKIMSLGEPEEVCISLDFNQFAFFGHEIPVRKTTEK